MSWPDFFGVFLESLYTSSLKTQLTRVQFSSLRPFFLLFVLLCLAPGDIGLMVRKLTIELIAQLSELQEFTDSFGRRVA